MSTIKSIDLERNSRILSSLNEEVREKEKKASKSVQEEGGEDAVELSSQGSLMAFARSEVSKPLTLREEKIAQLKEAVGSGNYMVQPRAVAEKMIDSLVVDEKA